MPQESLRFQVFQEADTCLKTGHIIAIGTAGSKNADDVPEKSGLRLPVLDKPI